MRRLILSASLLTFLHGAHAYPDGVGQFSTFPMSSPNGSFTFPATYPIILREDNTYDVTWTTNFNSVVLFLYQRGKAGGYSIDGKPTHSNNLHIILIVAARGKPTNGSFTWKARTIDADNKELFVIRGVEWNDFELGRPKSGDFFSAMFYIAQAASDTSSPSSSTPTNSASAAIKKGKKRNLGLGLGIGLGVALLLVLGGALLMLGRRKRRRAAWKLRLKSLWVPVESTRSMRCNIPRLYRMRSIPSPQKLKDRGIALSCREGIRRMLWNFRLMGRGIGRKCGSTKGIHDGLNVWAMSYGGLIWKCTYLNHGKISFFQVAVASKIRA